MKYLLTLVLACALAGLGWAQSYPQQSYPQQTYPQRNTTQMPVNGRTQSATIPVGTDIQIRTNEAINATQETTGRNYSAEIAQNVMGSNGSVLIPKGSPAELTVGKVSGGGTLGTGNEQVALELQSVTINGQRYQLATNSVNQQSSNDRGIGANKRTAEMTGGGALLGTVIGAIAGGGKGAAIGAAVGGAGGAATQVLTRGNQVSVPAESLLTFKLDQPITLQ